MYILKNLIVELHIFILSFMLSNFQKDKKLIAMSSNKSFKFLCSKIMYKK